MALKKCKECGGQVSTEAKQCPSCGAQQKRRSKALPLFLAFSCLAIVGALLTPQDDKEKGEPLPAILTEKEKEVPPPAILTEKKRRDRRVDKSIAVDIEIQSRRTIKNRMKDPESVKFKDVFGAKSAEGIFVCGQVNSKNSFGAYTGFTRFIANETTVLLDGMDATNPPFPDLWIMFCLNRL